MRKLVDAGFDVYGYITLTSDDDKNIAASIADFMDRLQSEVHPKFPLRTIPLRIYEFNPTKDRMGPEHQRALEIQVDAVQAWTEELQKRFSTKLRELKITEIPIGSKK